MSKMSELTSNNSEDFFENFTGSNLVKDVESVYSDKDYLNEESDEILQDDKEGLLHTKDKELSFWKFEYYQSFFNVDTYEVLRRLLYSFLPRPKSSFIRSIIRSNPDLYGPFWICTTLVFTIAICGNISSYIYDPEGSYTFDFKTVTIAASSIYFYWCFIPLFVFGFLKWKSSEAAIYTFLEILCIYGYSLTIYIPVSVLWMVKNDIFQWILLAFGATLSGAVLVLAFWPGSKENNKKTIMILIGFIIVFHTLLAIGFKLYFFNVSVIQPTEKPVTKPHTSAHPPKIQPSQ